MKINQKLTLSIKASLIILTGLFGLSAQANRFSRISSAVAAFKRIPASYDVWYRQQLAAYWSKDFITVERRKDTTSATIKLVKLEKCPENIAGLFSPSIDTIAIRFKGPLCYTQFLNSRNGEISQTLAHEYVHFAKDFGGISIDKKLYGTVFEILGKNEVMCFYDTQEAESTSQANQNQSINNNEYDLKHREFFCDLKGLELMQQGNPAAYQAFLREQYKKYIGNKLGRNENYPDAHEFLLCWALYKQEKENKKNGSDPYDIILHNFIDEYLEHRNLYKKTMKTIKFLKMFEEKRNLSFFQRMVDSFSASNWDHDKFIEELNKDAAAVKKIVRREKLDGMWVE